MLIEIVGGQCRWQGYGGHGPHGVPTSCKRQRENEVRGWGSNRLNNIFIWFYSSYRMCDL